MAKNHSVTICKYAADNWYKIKYMKSWNPFKCNLVVDMIVYPSMLPVIGTECMSCENVIIRFHSLSLNDLNKCSEGTPLVTPGFFPTCSSGPVYMLYPAPCFYISRSLHLRESFPIRKLKQSSKIQDKKMSWQLETWKLLRGLACHIFG